MCTNICEAPRYNTLRGSTECSQECNKILQSPIKIQNRSRALGVSQGELRFPFGLDTEFRGICDQPSKVQSDPNVI